MSAGTGSVDNERTQGGDERTQGGDERTQGGDERTQGGDESGGEYSVSFEDHTDTATADVTAARSPKTR